MYFVYVLKSLTRKYLYVGLTKDLERRVQEHNSGKEKTTQPYRPFVLVYRESYSSRKEARQREKYLKSGSGKEWLKKILFSPEWRNWQTRTTQNRVPFSG